MTAKTTRSIKNILIQPGFQIKLMSYFMGLFALTTASLYGATFLFFWNFKQKAIKVGIPEGHIFYTFLKNQKNDLDMLFSGLAMINLFFLIVIGFVVSHRIAGPLFKIKTHLNDLSPSSQDLQLRQKDFFKDMEPVINQLKNKLRK